jgi:hypothetical protein
VIFTGTAHAKYEMTILPDNFREESVVFVGPFSDNVFTRLLDTFPRLAAPNIRDEVTKITNCVPRDLMFLSTYLQRLPDPISIDSLEWWVESRSSHFQRIADDYYHQSNSTAKERFFKVLLHTFLGSTTKVNFEWNFVDLGLIYRSQDPDRGRVKHHILCRPAQRALPELFKLLPLPDDTKRRIYDGSPEGVEFETAICHQLICISKPVVLNATDLNGN